METVNGHALIPLTIQPHQDDPGQSRTIPDDPGRWPRVKSAAGAMSAHRGWLAAVPIVLVNAVAFCGQLAFLRVHLPWPLAGQVLVAVTLESVAVYLAWQAHLALIAADSALRLRLAAYAFAAVIGVMNYSHYMAAGWRPTFAAVTFGLMSVSSPWLWSVHSRRVSRDALLAVGDIEPHAVRLGMTRWAWHPARSCRVMFRATWLGVTKPSDAIVLPAIDATPPLPVVADGAGESDPAKKDDKRDDRRMARKRAPAKVTNEELAARAGVSVRTLQRRRNGKTGSAS